MNNLTPDFKRELNKAVALWLGYKVIPCRSKLDRGKTEHFTLIKEGVFDAPYMHSSEEEAWLDCPNFAEDRNLLAEVWDKFYTLQERHKFSHFLLLCAGYDDEWIDAACDLTIAWAALVIRPHFHLIAALRCVGRMTDELEALWKECQG